MFPASSLLTILLYTHALGIPVPTPLRAVNQISNEVGYLSDGFAHAQLRHESHALGLPGFRCEVPWLELAIRELFWRTKV